MNKRYARSLLAVPAAVLAALLTATTASALTTWTVNPGGATTAKTGPLTLKDTKTGEVLKCRSSLKATLASGSGLSGAGIGSISSFTFPPCVGPLGLTFTITTSHLPCALNAGSYDGATGTTTGSITGIHGTFMGPGCSSVFDGTGASRDNGTLAVTYTNGTQRLTFLKTGGNLHAYKVSGCNGLFNSNDHLTLAGTGTMTPAQTITSP
jgi:hypothetical protein